MAADPGCMAAIAAGRLRLLAVDIGPVAAWSWPADRGRMDLWPRYWREPWDASPPPDLVLLDGRFRVAAALLAAVRTAPGTPVLVQEFRAEPAYQAPLLRHFSLREEADGLAWLEVRRPLVAALLAADLASHGFDPR